MADTPLDVASCVARAAARDRNAADALVVHCHPLVARLVRSHRPRTIPEEDLVQEVLLKMLTHLGRYRPLDGIPFEHWLSRLAVRTCLDALRAERRRPQGHAAPLTAGADAWLATLASDRATPPDDDVLAARDLVERLLAALPPRDRLVLTLLDLEERSVAEVATTVGWSETLVKVRAFRARRRLRKVADSLARPREVWS